MDGCVLFDEKEVVPDEVEVEGRAVDDENEGGEEEAVEEGDGEAV